MLILLSPNIKQQMASVPQPILQSHLLNLSIAVCKPKRTGTSTPYNLVSQKQNSSNKFHSETKRDLSKPIINTPYQIELTQSTYLKFQSTREHIYRGSMEITPSSRLRENSLRYFLFSRDRDDGSYRDLANITALINAYKIGWLEWRDDGKVTYWYKGKRLTEPREYDPEEHKRHADNKEEPRALWVEGLSLPFYVRLCL